MTEHSTKRRIRAVAAWFFFVLSLSLLGSISLMFSNKYSDIPCFHPTRFISVDSTMSPILFTIMFPNRASKKNTQSLVSAEPPCFYKRRERGGRGRGAGGFPSTWAMYHHMYTSPTCRASARHSHLCWITHLQSRPPECRAWKHGQQAGVEGVISCSLVILQLGTVNHTRR